MKTGLEKLKEKLKSQITVIGSHVGFRESCFTELLGDVGFDFIWIDAEHSALDKSDILNHIIAARAAGTASIVRVPWNDPVLVKGILDMGVEGIVFPMIRNAEEAKLAVASCTYPPKGIRGVGTRRANMYGLGNRDTYIQSADENIWKVMQVEHIDNVDTLDDILKVEGVDAIVVGPNDFSSSMGKIGQVRDAEVMDCFDRIGEIARKHGKPFGVSMGYDKKTMQEWLDRGVNWIGLGFDFQFIAKAARETLENARSVLKEQA